MIKLLILSGKGGTGKTSIASALIELSKARAFADCDVDAPNLHLATKTVGKSKKESYYGLPKAYIDTEKCTSCGLCKEYCRFDAVLAEPYRIDPISCEGCGFCEAVCPVNAIHMKDTEAGEMELFPEEPVFSTAQLHMGNGNTGMLVTQVKKRLILHSKDIPFAVIDGSPGIGCPVIASLSGVDLVLMVAEPSISGEADLYRVIQSAEKFGAKIMVCINKYDTNPIIADRIKEGCLKQGIEYVGEIPYDPAVVRALNNGQSMACLESPAGVAVRELYEKIRNVIYTEYKTELTSM